jgi:hypothetical protein
MESEISIKKGFELVKIDNPIFPRIAPLGLGSELEDPDPLDEGVFGADG